MSNLVSRSRAFIHFTRAARIRRRMNRIMALTGRGGRLQKTKRLPFEGRRQRWSPNGKPLNEFDAVVNRLTNWQRHQWGRAGYPGLRDKDVEGVRPYLEMMR